MRRATRGPFGGVLAIVLGVHSVAACELFSLDGLTGGDAGGGGRSSSHFSSPDGTDGLTPTDASAHEADGISAGEAAAPPSEAGPLPDAASATDAPSPCGPDGGWILCGGACVDPSSDPANCNGCGNACATGLCGSTITESLASAPTAWSFNGSAFYNSYAPSAELTPIGNYEAGTFVYVDPVVVDSFEVTFEFRLGLQGGTRSDGIGFMIEQSGSTAVGGTGGGLGMTGLSGYGVELDVHDNGVCGDDDGDHVGVDDLTLCDSSEGTPTSLVTSGDLSSVVDLGDAHWHSADITLANGAVSATVDGNAVVTDVALPDLHVGQPYYLGFAGATGGLVAPDGGPGGYRQEVRNVAITFPTPRCL